MENNNYENEINETNEELASSTTEDTTTEESFAETVSSEEILPEETPETADEGTSPTESVPEVPYNVDTTSDTVPADFNAEIIAATEKEEQIKKQAKTVRKVVSVVALSVVAGLVFGAAAGFANKYFSPKHDITTTQTIISKSTGEPLPATDVATIAESCMPSIVTITNMSVSNIVTFFGTYEQESQSSGSGIVIGKNDTELLIVTNHHVIENSKELSVIFSYDEHIARDENGEIAEPNAFAAQVKGYDADKDLAVIAIKLNDISDEAMEKIAIATIGDSSQMRPGDQVVAIGNALGYGQSVTTGIISAVDRELAMDNGGFEKVRNRFIQTDAAINPGNSGGALLNMRGELIGINSVKIATSGVEGMGYAIPISDVEEIINELMVQETREIVEDEESRGYLGISGVDVSSSTSQTYGIPVGIYVNSVEEGLAADKAGIKAGYVITKFDTSSVSSITALQDKLKYYRAGEKVNVTVKVMGEGEYTEKVIEVTLSSRKDSRENAR